MPRLVVTGAAGLVGQNVIARLKAVPDMTIIGIDRHPANTALLRRLHPEIAVVEADLARAGAWAEAFAGADAVVIAQAQIGGLEEAAFTANNITATAHIVAAMRRHAVPYFVHVSSSVVNSRADDHYSRSKTAQERLIDTVTDIPHIVLRPTLMFGWFDRKHLGWIRRFMVRAPVFPVPGSGRFIRQPLYAGDFAAIILAALRLRLTGTHDVSGLEQVSYVDLIRLIRSTVKARTLILHIPVPLFRWLLDVYARFDPDPPFTTRQLEALILPETFPVVDWPALFGVTPTPLARAIAESFLDPRYGAIRLEF